MFRGQFQVPPLEMVDNVISASNIYPTTMTLNASLNPFMERKKETHFQCRQMPENPYRKQNKKHEGAIVKVHSEEIKTCDKEKYLGYYITK